MKNSKRYSTETRERAVRMVFDHEREHASQWATITSIAEKIGCSPETLRNWVRQAERDAGRRPGLTTEERAQLKELKREVRERSGGSQTQPRALVEADHGISSGIDMAKSLSAAIQQVFWGSQARAPRCGYFEAHAPREANTGSPPARSSSTRPA